MMNERIEELYLKTTELLDKYFKAMEKVASKKALISAKVATLSPTFQIEKDKVLAKLKDLLNEVENSWMKIKEIARSAYLGFNINDYSVSKERFNYRDPLKSLTIMVERYKEEIKKIKSAYDITSVLANTANSLIYLLRNYINDFDSLDNIYWSSGKADKDTEKIYNEILKIEDSVLDVVNEIFINHDEIRSLIEEENLKNEKEAKKTYKKVDEFTCPIFFKLGYKKQIIKEYKFKSDESLNLDDLYLYDYKEEYINLDETKETNDSVMFVLESGVNKDELIQVLMNNALISYPEEYVYNMIINSYAKSGELKALIDASITDNLVLYNMDNQDRAVKIPFVYINNPEYLLCDNEYASDKAFLFYFVNKDEEVGLKDKMTHLYHVKKKDKELIAICSDNSEIQLKDFKA